MYLQNSVWCLWPANCTISYMAIIKIEWNASIMKSNLPDIIGNYILQNDWRIESVCFYHLQNNHFHHLIVILIFKILTCCWSYIVNMIFDLSVCEYWIWLLKTKGPFIFYQEGGGLVVFEGGPPKHQWIHNI